jgi:hypothetical protein
VASDLEARGAVFHTSSDTEVLLHLYRHFGPGFVSKLEGEFAFALVDCAKGRAMLARDRFGVKPLFTSMRNGLLLFGSEAKAILAHPWTERRLDLAVLSRELHGTYLPQDCLFAGISAVEPGTYLLVSRQGVATHRYFRLEPEAAGTARLSFDEATEALESTFEHGRAGPFPRGCAGRVVPVRRRRFERGGRAGVGVAPSQVSAYSIDFVGTAESERAARNWLRRAWACAASCARSPPRIWQRHSRHRSGTPKRPCPIPTAPQRCYWPGAPSRT